MIDATPRRTPSSRRSPAAAAAAAGAPARRRRPFAAMAAAAACLCILLLALSAIQVRPQQAATGASVGIAAGVMPAPVGTAAASGLNAAGRPLLTPQRTVWQGHDLLYEAPQGARGLVLLLHKCGRSATDFWPRSAACPDCLGAEEMAAVPGCECHAGCEPGANCQASQQCGWHCQQRLLPAVVVFGSVLSSCPGMH